MNYKFKKYNISSEGVAENLKTYDYGIDFESLSESEIGLFHINSHTWNQNIIQEIIDQSNALNDNDEFEYQVEYTDFLILVNKEEVLMWARGSSLPDVNWPFEKFIDFMEKFKEFLEANSK